MTHNLTMILNLMYPISVRLSQRVIKLLFRHRVSTPRISQAFFASIADCNLSQSRPLSRTHLQELDNAKIVYCKSNDIHWVMESYNTRLNGKVILSGGTDQTFYDLDFTFGKIKKLFLQNSFVSDERWIFTLPIGIEDLSVALNGLPWHMKPSNRDKKHEILVGPWSSTHPVRKKIYEEITSQQGLIIAKDLTTPRKYAKLAANYTAVACPRGNGEDTHRLWESLYRNVYPVVQKNAWSLSIQRLRLPVLFVDEWTTENLISITKSFPLPEFASNKIPALWTKYWMDMLRKAV
jgi:hypothetical protein